MLKRQRRSIRLEGKQGSAADGWAHVGMRLTFRAEVMPGRDRVERTFTVASVLVSGRVELTGLVGQHAESEFEHTH